MCNKQLLSKPQRWRFPPTALMKKTIASFSKLTINCTFGFEQFNFLAERLYTFALIVATGHFLIITNN